MIHDSAGGPAGEEVRERGVARGLALQRRAMHRAGGGFLYQRTYYKLVKPYLQGLTTTAEDFEVIGDWFWGKVSIAQH